jgi:hypothetical protein
MVLFWPGNALIKVFFLVETLRRARARNTIVFFLVETLRCAPGRARNARVRVRVRPLSADSAARLAVLAALSLPVQPHVLAVSA